MEEKLSVLETRIKYGHSVSVHGLGTQFAVLHYNIRKYQMKWRRSPVCAHSNNVGCVARTTFTKQTFSMKTQTSCANKYIDVSACGWVYLHLLMLWRILRNFGLQFQVKRNDKITKKMCEKCVERINGFVLYRKICAATNIQLKLNRIDGAAVGVTNELNAVQKVDSEIANSFRKCSFPSSNPPVAYVSLIEDEPLPGNDRVSTGAGVDESDAAKCDESDQSCESNDPDPYMSPLEYETESDDGNHDNVAGSMLKRNAAVVHLHSKMTNGINSIGERSRDRRKPTKNTVFERRMCRQNFNCNDLARRRDTRKLYRCHVCQKSYRSKQWLRKHIDVVHTDKVPERFPCFFPACFKSFSQKSTLNRHIRFKHV